MNMIASRRSRRSLFSPPVGLLAAALGLAFVACTSTTAPQSGPTAAGSARPAAGHVHGRAHGRGEHHEMMGGMCPMALPGAAVSVTDVDGGVALSFTTTTGDLAELRRRVHRMAAMHQHHQGRRMEMGRAHGGKHSMRGGMMGKAHGRMPRSTATAEDIEGGARLLLRPVDPGQLDALRAHARAHADGMPRGQCAMAAGHPATP
jgi:hypothetical protein